MDRPGSTSSRALLPVKPERERRWGPKETRKPSSLRPASAAATACRRVSDSLAGESACPTIWLFATLELLGKDVGAAGEVVGGAQLAVSFGFTGALDELIDAGDERLFSGAEAAALGLRDQLEGLAPVILRGPPQLLLLVRGNDFLNGRPGRFGGRWGIGFGRRRGLTSRGLRRLRGRRRRGGGGLAQATV